MAQWATNRTFGQKSSLPNAMKFFGVKLHAILRYNLVSFFGNIENCAIKGTHKVGHFQD